MLKHYDRRISHHILWQNNTSERCVQFFVAAVYYKASHWNAPRFPSSYTPMFSQLRFFIIRDIMFPQEERIPNNSNTDVYIVIWQVSFTLHQQQKEKAPHTECA